MHSGSFRDRKVFSYASSSGSGAERLASPVVSVAVAEQAGRAARCRHRTARGPVGGQFGVPPAVVGLVEVRLAGTTRRRQALDPHPDQPQPGALQPQGVERPWRCRRPPGRRRWGRAGCVLRVIVVKSANRTLIETVRPDLAGRPQPGRGPLGQPSSSRRTTAGSSTSRENVSSRADAALRPRARPGAGRAPRPARAGARRRPGPARAAGCRAGCARCRHGAQPEAVSASSVFSPTPHSAPTGSGCRKATTSSAGTTSRPSGLAMPEASLATNLLAATPTEQVMPCSSCDRARTARRSAAGCPAGGRAPETSRNASSRDSGSTSGVIVGEHRHHRPRDGL